MLVWCYLFIEVKMRRGKKCFGIRVRVRVRVRENNPKHIRT
jgi:hypothetical protein